MSDYVPFSVREGGLRVRLGWWLKGLREKVALWLAPWLTPMSRRAAPEPEGGGPEAISESGLGK